LGFSFINAWPLVVRTPDGRRVMGCHVWVRDEQGTKIAFTWPRETITARKAIDEAEKRFRAVPIPRARRR